MLSEVNVVGKWFQDESDEGWRFDEIKFGGEAKKVFEQLDLNIEMYDYSARISGDKNHTYIPSHYFLYAIKIKPLVDLLANYISFFEKIAKTTSATDFDRLLTSVTSSNPTLNLLDSYSKDNFIKVFKNDFDRLNGKSILNKNGQNGKKFRSTSDFVRSILLKAMPVRDVSSDMLGQLIYAFQESPKAYGYLIEHYSSNVPQLLQAKQGDELLFMIMSILGWNNKYDKLFASGSGDLVNWNSISNAFLLSSVPVAGNSSYVEKPVHYHSAHKKYVFIKKGLLDNDTSFDHISKLISELWQNVVVEKDAEKFYLRSSGQKFTVTEKVQASLNKIFYGAPGTGKSYSIDQQTNGSTRIVTVFHPETQYSDFVGSLKPKMNSGNITYEFRPGPFTKALIAAYKTPSEPVFLIIEEINRAASAAVFGELFQLLDRVNGESKYEIDVTDPDMLDYINHELNLSNPISKIKIPGNLSLLATMNSSDQAVMPMDTAFKRRWSFEYIPIDFKKPGVPASSFDLVLSDGIYSVTWPQLAMAINQVLTNKQVAEDRLLGPFFLTDNELSNQTTALETLSSKLFVYLWDDVLRHHGREAIFAQSICHSPFGEVMHQFKNNHPIFSEQLEDQLKQVGITVKAVDSE